jgi:hypothetical protein
MLLRPFFSLPDHIHDMLPVLKLFLLSVGGGIPAGTMIAVPMLVRFIRSSAGTAPNE